MLLRLLDQRRRAPETWSFVLSGRNGSNEVDDRHVETEEKAKRSNIRTELNTAILKEEPKECQLLGPTYLLKKTTYCLFRRALQT